MRSRWPVVLEYFIMMSVIPKTVVGMKPLDFDEGRVIRFEK